jgi:glycosyltransferase involved in cell wall biosynthesis
VYSSRIVFLCHNVLPHESSPVDRLLSRIAFRFADAFLVHSGEDRDNLMAVKPDAVADVHPLPIFDMFRRGGLTRKAAREKLSVEGRMVLFFGLVRAYKGLGVLLEGFARSLAETPARLFIVGEFYEDKEKYLDQIERLGIGPHVTVVDSYVPNEEVEKYFAACDVVALPYLSATQSAIVQVAYSFDRPVIVTAVGGLPEVVDDGRTGYVIPKEDPEALAEAIGRFFGQDDLRRMERNIAETKDRFSWKRCKETLIALADDLGSRARTA